MSNVIITGFMGSGKSTISRNLALNLNKVFLDSDELIKNKFNLEIKEIFDKFGENFFRKEESLLYDFFKNCKDCIISLGGGFLKTTNLGFVIYLKASFDYIINRLKDEEKIKRPLLKDEKFARNLYNERLSIYEKNADFIIDIENKDLQDILSCIIKRIK